MFVQRSARIGLIILALGGGMAGAAASETEAGEQDLRSEAAMARGQTRARDDPAARGRRSPWRTIGRVQTERHPTLWERSISFGHIGRGFCSGFLVGPREVITAAHCLWDARLGRWRPNRRLGFAADYRNGRFGAKARVIAYRMLDIRRESGAYVEPALDFALLTLDEDLGTELGYLEAIPFVREDLVRALRNDRRFFIAGYDKRAPRSLEVQSDCTLLGMTVESTITIHDCGVAKGASGAPILIEDKEGFHLIGVHLGQQEVNGRVRGVALNAGEIMPIALALKNGTDPTRSLDPKFARQQLDIQRRNLDWVRMLFRFN